MKRLAVTLATYLLLATNSPMAEDAADQDDPWLVIRSFDAAEGAPEETIAIPLSVLKIASNLLPSSIRAELEADGIAIDEILRLADEEDLRGTIARIDDGQTGERIIIAID